MGTAMFQILKSLKSDEKGGTAIEYGLIISLIVIAMMSAFHTVANKTNNMWQNVDNAVTGG